MSLEPNAIGLGEFALRVVARLGAWFGLLVPEPDAPPVAMRLAEEVALMGDIETKPLDASAGASKLVRQVHEAGAGVPVAYAFERFSDDEWRRLDLLCSQPIRDKHVVIVLSVRAFERLTRNAPNLASLLGGAVWRLDSNAEILTDEEKAGRLETLRAWSGLSDAEMVARVERGELPLEPEHAEWLVLLGRGDLLGRV